ncbi:MAG: asparagine synthetase B, partial [Alphaproteobacteria bacterium]|nr:asparagine synthetase B [Alphaproteobacteria bacterium]
MCGLAGIWSADPPCARPELEARLGAMAAMLRHRGPDDSGAWTDGAVGLAHTRLAVIDLSPTGHQPMTDEGERAVLVYNGEIYNFAELRAELQAAGVVFRGGSDSEVLLRGYLSWGDAVVARLRGMFAFALWDRAKRRLLLARDRLGKKPLAY